MHAGVAVSLVFGPFRLDRHDERLWYGWFTERGDIAVLQAAPALLAELSP